MMQQLRWELFSGGDQVLAAVSGGLDSLSLLHVLWTAGVAHGLGTVQAAHLDHGLRGDESAAEARWVADWCAKRGIACHVGFADVAQLARERKISTQEAARLARYAFLEKTAAEIGAGKIATAHTRDDQVETVLANILRGTGLEGLRGIPEQRGRIVRPLLAVSRAEIEVYCTEHDLMPRQDPSNLETDHYTRNRIRLELLPELRREFNPNVDMALVRLSEIAGRDSDYLAAQAAAVLAEVTRTDGHSRLELDRAAMAKLHPAVLRSVLRQAIEQRRETIEGVTYEHLEIACHAVVSESIPTFSLTLPHPACTVRLTPQTVILTLVTAAVPVGALSVPLPVPGTSTLGEIGWTVTAGWEEIPGAIALDADAVDIPALTLRNWRVGDKIDPLGMRGHHKKLSDIFTNAKMPRSERHTVPIVADTSGIVWIVGHTIAERARVTAITQRRLFLSASRQEQETV